jgi:hypothetical protein
MPETELVSVELFIIMNQDGEYVVSHDLDNATEFFNDDYSGRAVETTKIILKMRPPEEIARQATATLPDDIKGGEVTLTLDEAK